MKRLLIEGMTRIFEITPAFRNAESGQRHNPEFTMLEWYRVGDSYEQGIELLLQLALKLFPGLPTANVKGENSDHPPKRTVAGIIQNHHSGGNSHQLSMETIQKRTVF